MPELNPPCFANRKEVHRVEVKKLHLFKIEYEFLSAAVDLCLQILHLLRLNSTAYP